MIDDYTTENERHHTKRGSGRMPHTRTSKPAGSKLWGKCPEKRRDTWIGDDGVWRDPRAGLLVRS